MAAVATTPIPRNKAIIVFLLPWKSAMAPRTGPVSPTRMIAAAVAQAKRALASLRGRSTAATLMK